MLPADPLPPNRNRRAGESVLRTHDPPPGAALPPPHPSPRRGPDRAYLDAAVPGAGNTPGDRQSFVQILRLTEIVAAELLPRFRKRTVGDQHFPVAHSDRGRGRNRLQPGG